MPLARDVIFVAEADEEGGVVQHDVAGARALGGHRRRVRAQRGRMDHEARRRPRAVREHLDGRQVVDSAHGHRARHVDAFVDAAAGQRDLRAVARDGQAVDVRDRRSRSRRRRSSSSRRCRARAAPPMSDYYRDLVGTDAARAKRADSVDRQDPLLHSLVRNTIAPVIMQGGFRANVIPGSAQATINLRMVPGSERGSLRRRSAARDRRQHDRDEASDDRRGAAVRAVVGGHGSLSRAGA